MANNPVKDEEEERLAQISITEFLQMASEAKIQLIDRLAANLLKMGERHALTAAEYYRQKFTGKEKEFPDLAYEHKRHVALGRQLVVDKARQTCTADLHLP